MKKKLNVIQIIPSTLSVLTVSLLIILVMGSFRSAERSQNSIHEIEKVHFPILENLAIGSRLQQSLDLLLTISIESKDPKYAGEYELARNLLNETVEQVNDLIAKNRKVLDGVEPIRRNELIEFEKEIVQLIREEKFSELHKRIHSQKYFSLKASFSDQLFATVQSVTEKREVKLVKEQKQLGNEYMLGLAIVALISIFVSIVSVLWVHLNKKSKELEWRAQNNARLAALGEMAGGVAHEINNPLAIIDGSLDMCLRDIDKDRIDSEKLRDRIEKSRSTLKRITKIVKGLRRFSREPGEDEMEDCPLQSLINESLDLSRERLRNMGVNLMIDISSELVIHCNQTEFVQVIINLVNNSLDEIRNMKDPWIKIIGRKSNDAVVLSVIDSGKGIPKDVAKHIMRPFFTTKAIGEGTGLGLSISHGIVKKHGGDLFVDETYPNTKFDIVLPSVGPNRSVA